MMRGTLIFALVSAACIVALSVRQCQMQSEIGCLAEGLRSQAGQTDWDAKLRRCTLTYKGAQ